MEVALAADAPLPGRPGDPVPQRAPLLELRLPADDEARRGGARLGLDAPGRGRGQREPGELRRGARGVPEGARPRRRTGPGSTSGSAACSWRGRGHRCSERRRRGATPHAGVRAGAARSIPRTPTPPTSSERSHARRESSTRRASSSRRPSSTIPSSRKAWSGWAGCSSPRARPSWRCLHSRKAVALNPEDDVAYFQLYQAHRALGHAAEQQKAQAEFQRLRSRQARAERLTCSRQHVVTQQELDAQTDAALGRRGSRSDERFREEPRDMSTTRPRSGFTPALALAPGCRCSWPPLGALAFAAEGRGAAARSSGLRTEYKENPLGIDARKPRLSWRIESDGARRRPVGLRDPRGAERARSGAEATWCGTRGKVASDESTQRAYDGPALQSGQRVPLAGPRLGRRAASASAWSAPAWWEMGLLEPSDWKASWIEPGLPEDVEEERARADAAARVQARGRRRAGAGLRHEPRPLRDAPERPARGRPALHARAGRATTSACSTRPTTSRRS